MPRSSAWTLSYDIRPSKQVERRIVLDAIDAAHEAGICVRSYPMIGMGGTRYIDFLVANKTLGIDRFISIEHDSDLIPRCEFNKPFGRVDIFDGSSAEFIVTRGFTEPSLVWMDYEQPLSIGMHDELVSLATSVVPNSFVVVTLSGELPERWSKIPKTKARLEAAQEEFGAFAQNLESDNFDKSKFRWTVGSLIRSSLGFGFSGRNDGTWLPFLNVIYKDSVWMVTVGGFFGEADLFGSLKAAIKSRAPFLSRSVRGDFYQIGQFNITDAERRLLDRAALRNPREKNAKGKLRDLGFSDLMIDQYAELMRFIPRYFESSI